MKRISKIILLALTVMTLTVGCKKLPEFTSNNGGGNTPSTTGGFSVSDSKQVYFAPGNLQYQSSTNHWRFAENPWDIMGESNTGIAVGYDGWIDLFGWGTGKEPTNSSQNNDDYSHYTDWGDNTIINGENHDWRTLSLSEWHYLINTRNTTSGIRFAKATMNDVCGVIFVPDNWSASYYDLNRANDPNVNFSINDIDRKAWVEIFEPYGAIFMPVTGCRMGVQYFDQGGVYWSSTSADDAQAYFFAFGDDSLGAEEKYISERFYGYAVRLAYELE